MKSNKRLQIEAQLKDGLLSMSTIAKIFGVCLTRVRTINKELTKPTRAEVRELYKVDEVMRKPFVGNGWVVL